MSVHRIPFALNRELQELAALDRFRARAVVDWLDVQIATASPTNFQTVQERLGAVLESERKQWVTAIDPGPGRAASGFVLRIHDPATHQSITGLIDRLSRRLPLTGIPRPLRLETAVDFYSKRADRGELEAMTLRLKHHLSVRGDKELESGLWTNRLDQVRALRSDTTLVIQEDEVLWRAYLKDIDNNKQPIADPAKHRARVETLLPIDLAMNGCFDLDALRTLRFETLTRWFVFRRVLPEAGALALSQIPLTPAELARQHRVVLALRRGSRELQVQSKRERRKHPAETRADSELRERVRAALRELTRRFCAEKPGKSKRTGLDEAEETVSALRTT